MYKHTNTHTLSGAEEGEKGQSNCSVICVEEDRVTQNKYNENEEKTSINKLYSNYKKIRYEKSTKPRPHNQKEKKENND